MTTRKQIKKQHRLQREAQQRASRRTNRQRIVIQAAPVAAALAAAVVLAFVFRPWGGSSADEVLPVVNLTIGDNFFQPESTTIEAGLKYELKLVNSGLNTHDIWGAGNDGQTSTGDDYRSDPIPGGGSDSVKIQYDTPGTYYFVCTFHAGQGGQFVVQ